MHTQGRITIHDNEDLDPAGRKPVRTKHQKHKKENLLPYCRLCTKLNEPYRIEEGFRSDTNDVGPRPTAIESRHYTLVDRL